MKIKYEKLFSIDSNFLIFFYSKLNKCQQSQNQIIRKLAQIGSLIFKRIAFSLLENNVQLIVNASIRGKQFRARSTNSQFHSIYFHNFCKSYEPDVYGAIEVFLPEGGTMIDIGSNWGHHTFVAATLKNANVFAFEPNTNVFNDLSRIVTDLNLEQRVSIYNVGLGSENSDLVLTQGGFESGIGSVDETFIYQRFMNEHWLVRLFDKWTLKKTIVQKVKIKLLDDYFDSKTNTVDLIKLDCEGMELSALKGAVALLERDKPVIVFEIITDESCSNYHQFCDFFGSLGYELFEIITDLDAGDWDIKIVKILLPKTQYNLLAKYISSS
jgi:FkbM family methyltransferase